MVEVEPVGIGIDIGIDSRGVPGPEVRCENELMSLKYDTEGDTARRLDDEG